MISIIGGGYIGGYLAYLLAKKNQDVTVYEEHSEIGRPYRDTGIVTSLLSDVVDIKDEFILNVVNKVKVYVGDQMLELPVKDEYVLDRVEFSKYLMEMALSEGAILKLNHRLVNFKVLRKEMMLNFFNHSVKTDVLIGADGAYSAVAKYSGLHRNVNPLMGMEARVKMDIDESAFEVYPSFIKDFFGWVVPEGDGVARIGLATRDNVNHYFEKFLKMRNVEKILSKNGGAILSYDPGARICSDNVYLIGDAAGLVKSSTGGGILIGLMAAQELTTSLTKNKDYHKLMKKRLGKELWYHSKIRKTLDKFSEDDYLRLISLLRQKRVLRLFQGVQRDYPSTFVFGLLFREPRLLRYLGKLF